MDAATASPGWLAGGGLVGGNLQTLWPAVISKRFVAAMPRYRRERWTTPDADFIDIDWVDDEGDQLGATARPLLVLFHGLEGSSASHYARGFAQATARRGWRFAVAHFRGCSGEPNLTERAYHSGDFEEIGWILERFRQRHGGPRLAVGVSLGGNALLRWAEECGESASRWTDAIAAVSSPVDLAAGGQAISRGFNRHVYTRMFMRSLRPKVLRKLERYPGLFDRRLMLAARDLFEFDNLYTAPVHGFRDTNDYWLRASAKAHLRHIRIPALLLNALNDPFVPAASLPRTTEVGSSVTLWQPPRGGHGGFATGAFPGHLDGVPARVMDWLQSPSGAHDPGARRRG
jgi:predicted alpha/beta-fold hydrolase